MYPLYFARTEPMVRATLQGLVRLKLSWIIVTTSLFIMIFQPLNELSFSSSTETNTAVFTLNGVKELLCLYLLI